MIALSVWSAFTNHGRVGSIWYDSEERLLYITPAPDYGGDSAFSVIPFKVTIFTPINKRIY